MKLVQHGVKVLARMFEMILRRAVDIHKMQMGFMDEKKLLWHFFN